jgi:hypothetical protein
MGIRFSIVKKTSTKTENRGYLEGIGEAYLGGKKVYQYGGIHQLPLQFELNKKKKKTHGNSLRKFGYLVHLLKNSKNTRLSLLYASFLPLRVFYSLICFNLLKEK